MQINLTPEERVAVLHALAEVDFNIPDRIAEIDAKTTTELESPERLQNIAFNIQMVEGGEFLDERIIDDPDFVGMDFLEGAVKAARAVARIEAVHPSGRAQGIATGFLVSPNVLLTNWHVIRDEFAAQNMQARFGYDGDRSALTGPEASFRLLPKELFFADQALDFAVVAVSPVSHQNTPLSAYGWIDFVPNIGDLPLKWYANIVQHPQSRPKELVVRNNRHLKLLETMVVYESDTEPGSSGSPVFNDYWQLVALHRTGIPATDNNGNWIGLDGKSYAPAQIHRENIKWLANGGSKISLIDAKLRERLSDHPLVAPILDQTLPDHPQESRTAPQPTTTKLNASTAAEPHRIVIPVQIELDLSLISHKPQPAVPTPEQEPELESTAKRRVNINRDYSGRQGYDPLFLDPETPVALPGLEAVQEDLAPLLADSSQHELRYHNATIVMSARRRLAYFAAANANGGGHKVKRPQDAWSFDPRLSRDYQLGEALYKHNPLDRGHLNRSEDLAWGLTEQEAERSQDDTFHFTNCSPQHENFNKSSMAKGVWGALENWVLQKANQAEKPFVVFNGPVFSDSDPFHRGVPVPKAFWKVIVVPLRTDPERKLSASAYLLCQADQIQDLPLELKLTDEDVIVLRTTFDELKDLTRLDFDHLKPYEAQNPFETESHHTPLISPAQVVL